MRSSCGICTATKRKSSFVALCIKIINKENINEDISNFKNTPTEKYNYINIVHDKNIIIYTLFLPIHTFASLNEKLSAKSKGFLIH